MSKKFKPPAFQFWAKEWLASPSRRMMTPTAQCAYINLLCSAWDNDPVGTLPNLPDDLWKLADISKEEWLPCRDQVLAMFERDDESFPGRLYAPKLRDYFEELVVLKVKKSKAGKKGAAAKWGRETNPGVSEEDEKELAMADATVAEQDDDE
jgi:hypothetical protein